jgi:hypothetical protein
VKCPACKAKPGKPHRVGCPFGIPISYDPSPKTSPPVDPVQAHLAQIEEWAGTVNARLAALEAPQAYPDGAPPGVVSPHVARNLAAIRAWCSPTFTWGDTRTALDKIDALIVVALAGGDVDPPPPTSGMIGTR